MSNYSQRPLAVITGASSGIGEHFARRYAREGFDLLLVARSGNALRRLADDLSVGHGVHVTTRVVDLADPPAASALADELQLLPRLDHLVNNAGTAPEGDLGDTSPAAIRALVELNVVALTLLTRAAVFRMRAAGRGTIINVASAAAYFPMPHFAVYAASKSFVLMLTEAVSEETRASGVRVIAVSPGDTETRMSPGTARFKRQPQQVVDTAWRAVDGRKASVVDGRLNVTLIGILSRLLPRLLCLRVVERLMRSRQAPPLTLSS